MKFAFEIEFTSDQVKRKLTLPDQMPKLPVKAPLHWRLIAKGVKMIAKH